MFIFLCLFQKGISQTIPKVHARKAFSPKMEVTNIDIKNKKMLTLMSSYVSERWLVAPILEAKRLKEDTQFKTL
jgi:hypothetical protein